MRGKVIVFCVCFILICISPCLSIAGDKWDFIIAPYALLPNITGDASVGALEGADVDVGTTDILENLELGGMIQFEALHESGYGVIMAYNFMDLGGKVTGPGGQNSLGADIFQGIFEGYGMYRVKMDRGPLDLYGGVRWWNMDVDVNVSGVQQGIFEGYGMYRVKMDRGPLDLYGGVRWWDMDVDVNVSGVQKVKSREDWVDPVVGVRWMPQITDNWHVIVKGDIGGFGISSDFTWNLQGGFVWDATDYLSLVFQYRALSVDYSNGTVGTSDRFAYDTITHGPMFGLAFRL